MHQCASLTGWSDFLVEILGWISGNALPRELSALVVLHVDTRLAQNARQNQLEVDVSHRAYAIIRGPRVVNEELIVLHSLCV